MNFYSLFLDIGRFQRVFIFISQTRTFIVNKVHVDKELVYDIIIMFLDILFVLLCLTISVG